jgi:PucR C-terminal helix-turn-helix domain/GGDEF-like domain
VGATLWRLNMTDGEPRVGDSDLPLERFFDGLTRIVFLEDRRDLAHVETGDLCVALGGAAGRTAGALKRAAAKLQKLGAVGLLAHSNVLDAAPTSTAHVPDGPFPIVLIDRGIEWPDVLQPLMKIDRGLRNRVGNTEMRRADLVREIIEYEGRVYINPGSALEVGLDLLRPTRCIYIASARRGNALDARIEEAVAFELLDHDPSGTVVIDDDALLAFEGSPSDGTRDRLASSLLFRARSIPAFGDVMVGTGSHLVGPEGIFRSLRQASWAARVGLTLHGPNHVSRFDTLGAFAWLEPIAFDAKEDATSAIEMIVEKDARQGTRLLETLRVFLETRRLKEAADRLFVHRNTLRYRLDAINRLTGHDVQSADGRLVLELQLRLAMVKGTIPQVDPDDLEVITDAAPELISLDGDLDAPLVEDPSTN